MLYEKLLVHNIQARNESLLERYQEGNNKMNKFGMQYTGESNEMFSEEKDLLYKSNEQHEKIKDVLRQFQAGYAERDVEKTDAFVKELFVIGKDTYILGTGTGELFFGSEQIKTLIIDDWKYWGNVNIDFENIHIEIENEVAWFAATGSVKYAFEDTPERYDSYLNFIKSKVEDPKLTPKQKITFINWVLSLTYHQRFEKKREYLLPLRLSGVLLKDDSKWKFAHIQFSMPKGDFPDERFENSKEHLENYNNQNAIVDKYFKGNITIEQKSLLKSLETEFIGQKEISRELVSKYFSTERVPYIIAPDNQLYVGTDQIKEFLSKTQGSILSLDLKHVITTQHNSVTWITAFGTLNKNLKEDELHIQVLNDLKNLFQTSLTSKEKLFAAHRSISYVLKESASGTDYTCPIRLTAVILRQKTGLAFNNIHFSFPSYWIFEEKTDSI